jgi:signal transduction histidine kinase
MIVADWDQNSHEVFGGSGLGLFVSRQLCELMGGRIDVRIFPKLGLMEVYPNCQVDSVFGNGATFRFYIRASTSELHSEPSGLRSLGINQSPQAQAREVLTRPLQ